MKSWKHTIFVPRKTDACIYRKILDYFTFGAVIQFTIRIACKRVRISHAIEFTSVIGIRNQGEISGPEIGPECMGVLRGCDDGED